MAPKTTTKKDPRAWDALTPPLADWILDSINSNGWGARMTPVQAATIPLFRRNTDVVVEAVTGSGKTLSYLIPTIDKILRADESLKQHNVTGIVVSPTRELAQQIYDVLTTQILPFHPPSAEILLTLKEDEKRPVAKEPVVVPQLLIAGLTKPRADLSFFVRKSPNLLVATPGRLAELLASPLVKTSNLEVLVMDEADRLLDLGFKPQLNTILGYLPKQRRTGLFSASMSEAVSELIRAGLRNPQRIAVTVKSLKDGSIIEEVRLSWKGSWHVLANHVAEENTSLSSTDPFGAQAISQTPGPGTLASEYVSTTYQVHPIFEYVRFGPIFR